jgi:hypothetical protein
MCGRTVRCVDGHQSRPVTGPYMKVSGGPFPIHKDAPDLPADFRILSLIEVVNLWRMLRRRRGLRKEIGGKRIIPWRNAT